MDSGDGVPQGDANDVDAGLRGPRTVVARADQDGEQRDVSEQVPGRAAHALNLTPGTACAAMKSGPTRFEFNGPHAGPLFHSHFCARNDRHRYESAAMERENITANTLSDYDDLEMVIAVFLIHSYVASHARPWSVCS